MIVILSFLIILLVIALVGLSAGRLSKPNKADYYLAGKSLSPWIVGLSAMATNNSGYMFIGLIGFTYLVGLPSIWLMIGWIVGDFLISRTVHKKINQAATENSNVTYASVIGAWSEQGQFITKFIGLLSLIFLIVYASAQFVSGGKTLMVIFGWDLWLGIGIGSIIVFMYTMAGGIRASIWTDVVQAFIMVCSMTILVVTCFLSLGGINVAIDEWLMENAHPTESESYTYTDTEVDETTDHQANVSDMVERHPLYFAKRVSPDASEYCIKSDLTFTELKALPVTIKVFTNEETKAYMAENWVEE